MRSLAVIVVSANSARWLPACLRSVVAAAACVELDLVVVDSGSTDDTAAVTAEHAPARLVRCANDGFAHANNRGLETTSSDWVLFLNPDTEIVDGELSALITEVERNPHVGIAGVRQLWPDGSIQFSMRRFPAPVRWLGEALGSESWPVHPTWSGERVLDEAAYSSVTPCDWVSGSFMLVRRTLVDRVGGMDERFFLYSEEPDYCLRALRAGWRTQYFPSMTIIHHGGNESSSEALAAQLALSRKLYIEKHATRPMQAFGVAALALGYLLRLVAARGPGEATLRRRTSQRALRTLLGRGPLPFPRAGTHVR